MMRHRVCSCGYHVPEHLTRCPSCGADVSARPPVKRKKSVPGVIDCPKCGTPVFSSSTASGVCPHCGADSRTGLAAVSDRHAQPELHQATADLPWMSVGFLIAGVCFIFEVAIGISDPIALDEF